MAYVVRCVACMAYPGLLSSCASLHGARFRGVAVWPASRCASLLNLRARRVGVLVRVRALSVRVAGQGWVQSCRVRTQAVPDNEVCSGGQAAAAQAPVGDKTTANEDTAGDMAGGGGLWPAALGELWLYPAVSAGLTRSSRPALARSCPKQLAAAALSDCK